MSKTEQIPPPVTISAQALHALNVKIREWTGWKNGSLRFGKTTVSPYAETDFVQRAIIANPEPLVLNPNRVLLTVTPFRLRQEAVLTGALLHEAGHARHSLWFPNTPEQAAASPLLHSDGTDPTPQAVALARLMEEPRVEGLMAGEADYVGAIGLGWTMRAAAAHLLPPTDLSSSHPQQIMDLITSWALRAGRQIALAHHVRGYTSPRWVHNFNSLLHQTIVDHLTGRQDQGAVLSMGDPVQQSLGIVAELTSMIHCEDDHGSEMIDSARTVLDLLFPETQDDDEEDDDAMPSFGCGVGSAGDEESDSESGDEGEGDESGADGEGNTEPEDEGSGDDPGAGDSGDDETEPQKDGSGQESDDQDPDGEEDDEDSDGGSDGDSDGDSDEEPKEESEEDGGASASTSALAEALAQMEASCKAQVDDEAETQAAVAPPVEAEDGTSKSAGSGSGNSGGGSWRPPSKDEREVAKGAEQFLRDMIDASESSKRSLTDQPSAVVDGAALSAWKAGGQVREPHFFIRTRRNVEPSPPIKIAILVDVSASMDDLQEPSALLSWALASAALDLRNFAGRGQRVESCLIHWGDDVRVMQRPGELLPGIRNVPCNQGTSVMHEALETIETLMPGFYDMGETPINRLIVQFTDWRLYNDHAVVPAVSRALESGVNMLSVVPSDYTPAWASLPDILRQCPIQRGATSLIKYQRGNPESVWQQAAQALDVSSTNGPAAPFPGF